MVERFDSDPDAFRNRLDVVFQRGLGIRVTQVRLDILDSRQLSHIRRASAPEHLVRDAEDFRLLAGFFKDAEKEIVGIDHGAPCRGKDEGVRGGFLGGRPPPLKFGIDGNRKPDVCVAALGLCFDFDAICDATVDTKAVLRFIVPAKCEKFTWPESEHKEHPNNQSVAITEVEQNNGNLFRREVHTRDLLA